MDHRAEMDGEKMTDDELTEEIQRSLILPVASRVYGASMAKREGKFY